MRARGFDGWLLLPLFLFKNLVDTVHKQKFANFRQPPFHRMDLLQKQPIVMKQRVFIHHPKPPQLLIIGFPQYLIQHLDLLLKIRALTQNRCNRSLSIINRRILCGHRILLHLPILYPRLINILLFLLLVLQQPFYLLLMQIRQCRLRVIGPIFLFLFFKF